MITYDRQQQCLKILDENKIQVSTWPKVVVATDGCNSVAINVRADYTKSKAMIEAVIRVWMMSKVVEEDKDVMSDEILRRVTETNVEY